METKGRKVWTEDLRKIKDHRIQPKTIIPVKHSTFVDEETRYSMIKSNLNSIYEIIFCFSKDVDNLPQLEFSFYHLW